MAIQVGAKLEIDPEIIEKLDSESVKLWTASHDDGSDTRINGDKILEESYYGVEFGIIAAVSMWIRKLFRNRNKTPQDLEAEKEAYRINKTCGALEEMLPEYLRSAREGLIDGETLDELTDTLQEMSIYRRDGKLDIPGQQELSEIYRSISGFTAAIAENRSRPAVEAARGDEFCRIMTLLEQQKELIR